MTLALSPSVPAGSLIELMQVGGGPLQTEVVDIAGGGGGGGPLSLVFFVDVATTTPIGDQDGSIGAPFALLQSAIDAVPTGSVIYVVPGNYSGQFPTITGKVLSLIGLVPGNAEAIQNFVADPSDYAGPQSISTDSFLTLQDMLRVNAITSQADLFLIRSNVGTVTLGVAFSSLYCIGGARHADSLPAETMLAFQYEVGRLTMTDCALVASGYVFGKFNTTLSVGSFDLYDCRLLSPTINISTSGLAAWLVDTFFDDGITINGTAPGTVLELDALSYANALRHSVAFVDAAAAVPEGQLKAQISVVVPALAAAELGYVDVSTVGTELAGLGVGNVVVATPTEDLAAAGATNGFYASCRVSAADTIRLAFVGLLAGGASDFIFCRVDPALTL